MALWKVRAVVILPVTTNFFVAREPLSAGKRDHAVVATRKQYLAVFKCRGGVKQAGGVRLEVIVKWPVAGLNNSAKGSE